jgi:cell wall-associated NlpC family hydrolase
MSIDTAGPMAAMARVAAIQSRFAVMAPAGATTAPTTAAAATVRAGAARSATGGSATATAAPSFDDALSAALTEVGGASESTAAGDVGTRALAAAKKYLGVPYIWGGTDPAKGLDCSGLVQRAYRDVGVELPRVAADQARAGTAVPDLAHARPGDLLAFGSPVDHIGIYAGNHTMVVAPRAGKDVMVQDVYRTPTAIRRIGDPAQVSGTSGAAFSAASLSSAQVVPQATGSSALGASASAPWVPAHLRSMFAAAAARHGVPVQLLAAVAKAESGFDPSAVSGAGAVGLMQLMPATARGLGVDPRDPAQAVDGAARLLASHLDRFGSVPLALAAYNAGPGAVQRYGGIPPYPETQQYVRRVLGYAGGAA